MMAKPMPGTPSRHLLEDATRASYGVVAASSGRAPKALIASTSSRRPRRAVTPAISSTGLSTPEVVSQWTTATCEMASSAASAASRAAGSTGVSSGVSRTTRSRPRYSHMRTMRVPYDPLTRTASLPERGTRVPIIASTMKVPLPWSGTQTWVPWPPASSTSRSRTRAFSLMNSASREPQSWSIASLTAREVVSGPGVSSQGSRRGSVIAMSLSRLVSCLRSRVTIGHGMLREGIHGQPCSTDLGESSGSGGAGTTATGAVDRGGSQSARPRDRADGPGALGSGDRRPNRLYRGPGKPDSTALCRRGPGGVVRPTEIGPAADGERAQARADRGPDTAATRPRGDALDDARCGPDGGGLAQHRAPDLAGACPAAPSGDDLQVHDRSAGRGQDPRCSRPVPAAADQRRGGERRREDADPGAEPDAAPAALAPGPAGPPNARLPAQRPDKLVCGS